MKHDSLRGIHHFPLGFKHFAIAKFIFPLHHCPITFTLNRCNSCSNYDSHTAISISLTWIILLRQVDLRTIIRSSNRLSRNAKSSAQNKQNQTQILHKTTFYSKTQYKYKMFNCLIKIKHLIIDIHKKT